MSRLGRQKIILEKELEKKHLLSLEEKINTEDNELFQKKSKTHVCVKSLFTICELNIQKALLK